MDAIMVLMQVGHPGDWSDRGVPAVVTGYGHAAGPIEAGAEWMFDHHPSPVGDDWRLLVWTDVRSGAWHHDKPDVVVTPALYRAAIAGRGLSRERSRRRHPTLKPQPITHKIRVDQLDIGDRVLVTQDRQNTAVPSAGGPWYLANQIDEGCVAAGIRQIGITTRSDNQTITLKTALGDIGELPLGQPVIPVDES